MKIAPEAPPVTDKRATPASTEKPANLLATREGSNVVWKTPQRFCDAAKIWREHLLKVESSTLEKLKKGVDYWNAIEARRVDQHPRNLEAKLKEARNELINNPSTESCTAVETITARLEVAKNGKGKDGLAMRAAGDEVLRTVIGPILKKLIEQRLATVRELADELEKNERAAAERFGVEFSASETLLSLHHLLLQLSATAGSLEYVSPLSVCKMIGLNLAT